MSPRIAATLAVAVCLASCAARTPTTRTSATLALTEARAPAPRPASDAEIAAAVSERIAQDQPIAIDVSSEGGVVTLRGVVAHLPAARRAVDVALRERDVRGVVDAIEVVPEARDDDAIAAEIGERLASHAALDELDVGISVEQGQVVLAGDVRSLGEGALVVEAAESVRGVRAVTSALRVAPVPGDDRSIVRTIVDRLRADARIDAGLVEVRARGGAVQLAGTVASAREREIAASLAAIEGVRAVDASALEVGAWRPEMERIGDAPTDEEIAAAISAAIEHDARVCRDRVDVSVTRGEVTLTGSVHSLAARRAAVESAGTVLGVRAIDESALRVIPMPLLADEAIDERVSEALAITPWIDRSIEIDVREGHVVLRGTLDGSVAEEEALAIVSAIGGVRAIDDRIETRAAK